MENNVPKSEDNEDNETNTDPILGKVFFSKYKAKCKYRYFFLNNRLFIQKILRTNRVYVILEHFYSLLEQLF